MSIIVAGGLMVGALALAAATPKPGTMLYVTNSESGDITVIDLARLKVVGDIQVGAAVHGAAVQADGRKLFTTVESNNTLRIIDTTTNKIEATIKLTGRPNQCAVTPDGKYVAAPIRNGDSVDIVDVAQRQVIKTLPVKIPHNCFSAGSDRYLFVSSMGSDEIDRIDLTTMQYSGKTPVGGVPRPYVVTKDGRTMYVALSDLHGFAMVDVAGKKPIRKFRMPAINPTPRPHPFEPINTLTHGLALTPDETELWVTSLLDDCMYVYNVAEKKIVARVPTGEAPNWVTFSPDGKYCCVSNAGSDDCSIIDVKTRKEVARIRVGKVPKRLVATVVPAAPGF
ncbi:MAG TPA: cytochrome D1 domain-containing protein [Terriglobia bacterium]|nr:cytochrome D1 domain-containing protein [Terriglobia bacterium]